MLSTSQDILWLVLAFVILWIGIFAGWGVFYLMMVMRDVRKITSGFRQKMDAIDEILQSVKRKVNTASAIVPPIIEGATKIMDHFKEKKEKKGKK